MGREFSRSDFAKMGHDRDEAIYDSGCGWGVPTPWMRDGVQVSLSFFTKTLIYMLIFPIGNSRDCLKKGFTHVSI
jgi:hypothetical protein